MNFKKLYRCWPVSGGSAYKIRSARLYIPIYSRVHGYVCFKTVSFILIVRTNSDEMFHTFYDIGAMRASPQVIWDIIIFPLTCIQIHVHRFYLLGSAYIVWRL